MVENQVVEEDRLSGGEAEEMSERREETVENTCEWTEQK